MQDTDYCEDKDYGRNQTKDDDKDYETIMYEDYLASYIKLTHHGMQQETTCFTHLVFFLHSYILSCCKIIKSLNYVDDI